MIPSSRLDFRPGALVVAREAADHFPQLPPPEAGLIYVFKIGADGQVYPETVLDM